MKNCKIWFPIGLLLAVFVNTFPMKTSELDKAQKQLDSLKQHFKDYVEADDTAPFILMPNYPDKPGIKDLYSAYMNKNIATIIEDIEKGCSIGSSSIGSSMYKQYPKFLDYMKMISWQPFAEIFKEELGPYKEELKELLESIYMIPIKSLIMMPSNNYFQLKSNVKSQLVETWKKVFDKTDASPDDDTVFRGLSLLFHPDSSARSIRSKYAPEGSTAALPLYLSNYFFHILSNLKRLVLENDGKGIFEIEKRLKYLFDIIDDICESKVKIETLKKQKSQTEPDAPQVRTTVTSTTEKKNQSTVPTQQPAEIKEASGQPEPKQQAFTTQQALNQQLQQQTTEINKLREQLKQTKRGLEEEQKEKQRLQQELLSIMSENTQLKAQAADFKKGCELLKQQNSKLSEEKTTAQQKLDSFEKKMDRHIEVLKNSLSTLK